MGGIVGIVLVYVVIKVIITIVKAIAKSASGGGSVGANVQAAFGGLPELSYRLVDKKLGSGGTGPDVKLLEIRGRLPLSRAVRLAAITHAYDVESGLPLLCALDRFQEPTTVVFCHETSIGLTSPGQGLVDWAGVGFLPLEILTAPYSGSRKIRVLSRFIDLNTRPPFTNGQFSRLHPGFLWESRELIFEHDFGTGYQEQREERERAHVYAVQVAVAVAMSDGGLHDSEGEAIKRWMQRTIETAPEDRRATVKDMLNGALRSAFDSQRSGRMNLDGALDALAEIEDQTSHYEALQLAFDVLAADGEIAAAELAIIDRVAEALDLDLDEVSRIRDQKLVGLNVSKLEDQALESALGIHTGWDREQKLRHLRSEFQKWNSRMSVLSVGPERENAQRMLESIAQLRKLYG